MTHAYATLTDGTLVDFEQRDDGLLTIRAGQSLTPAERPIVFRLRDSDARQLGLHLAAFLTNESTAASVLEAFLQRGQQAQRAVDQAVAVTPVSLTADVTADAEAAYALFFRMSSDDLRRLLVAHGLDEQKMTAPASIVFTAGRQALIRFVLHQRAGDQ